jgi:O-antigen ligase
MSDRLSRFLPLMIAASCVVAAYAVVFRPAYFSNSKELATLLFLQIVLAAIWSYRVRFFPLLLAVFLWAGTVLPLNAAWTSGRWFVLAVGALVGLVLYARDPRSYFGTFHLVALFCVVATLASAAVSAYPNLALLKAMSLLLLFLFGSSGARLTIMGRKENFFSALLVAGEVLVYATAISYFLFQFKFFGNPNSLGAVMGVAAVPILLWGILVSERSITRWRRTFAFALALVLLFSSYARAGIVAAMLSSILICIALRRYSLLLQGLGVALLLATLVATFAPLHQQPSDSLTSTFIYKGRTEDGVLASRKPIWDETVAAIQENPWLGSGFGTSPSSSEVVRPTGSFESDRDATREHGNSYLAITEWVGFAGDIPFLALIILIILNVAFALRQMGRTGNAFSPAVPLAGILIAGLVHAAFEDWLFAVGYYLCVFFWSIAFIMVDIVRVPSTGSTAQPTPHPWTRSFRPITLGP